MKSIKKIIFYLSKKKKIKHANFFKFLLNFANLNLKTSKLSIADQRLIEK